MTRLLLVAAVAVVAVLAAGVVSGAEWNVYPGASIQDAVDGAGDGDMIYVHAGTYIENVNVDKRVTLIGDGVDVVTVWAANASNHVFDVTANWVNITGFTVTNATDSWNAGICLNNVNRCNISDNTASNSFYGIYLSSSGNNNTLSGNNALINAYGISLSSSNNNTLRGNNVSSNNGQGIYLSCSNNNMLIENNANFNYGGIYLQSSWNNNLNENTANFNTNGFTICSSSNNLFFKNTVKSNKYHGITFNFFSNNNTLDDNIFLNNQISGISLSSSNSNIFTNNDISSNSKNGIYIYDSTNNYIHHNNIINNTKQATDLTSTNFWDSSYPSGGNYWNDYKGIDFKSGPNQNMTGSDGIGDTPYDIPGGNSTDHYPLMHPWEEPPPLKGDLDGDSQITSKDAAIVLEIAVGSSQFDDAADVSGDGRVTSLDALIILQVAAGTC